MDRDTIGGSSAVHDKYPNFNTDIQNLKQPVSRSVETKGRGEHKGHDGLYAIPEKTYSVKGLPARSALGTPLGLQKQKVQKRDPSNGSEKSSNSAKSGHSSTSSNPYQRSVGFNSASKKNITSKQGISATSKQSSSNLYDRIKTANNQKKKSATIFAFLK